MSSDSVAKKSFHYSRILEITKVIQGYDGNIPFHRFLKDFFSKNKKFGSTDRKVIAEYCYCFFRLGRALPDENFLTRLTIGYYLVNGLNSDLIIELARDNVGLDFHDEKTLNGRLAIVQNTYPQFKVEDIFKYGSALSDGVVPVDFCLSMFAPPKVWVRMNKTGKRDVIAEECEELKLSYEFDEELPDAISFHPSSNLQQLPPFVKGCFKIQDRSSQIAGSMINAQNGEHWWDCCSGAGGKSLQLLDTHPGVRITASDKRESILANFKERLSKSEKSRVELIIADLEENFQSQLSGKLFDGIIADVPCSGSGTWGRTPEMLTFFNEQDIPGYAARQKKIVSNALPWLKPGGFLVYITCSVFKAENEEVVDYLCSFPHLDLMKSALINGISHRSDSMFYAIFEEKSVSKG